MPESEKMGEQSPSDELKSSSHQEFSKTSPEPVSAAKAGSLLAGEAALDDSQILQPVSATANARSGTAYRFDRQAEHHAVSSSHAERLAGKRKIAYGVIAVALVAALLYLAGVSDKPAVEKFVQEMLPTKIEQAKAPLELDIPKNMPPVDIDVYVVVKDDTLWSISERFTGNPFNYPRIAGGNQIANPDLIYPGQRIRLIK